jgi:hypothetical protein
MHGRMVQKNKGSVECTGTLMEMLLHLLRMGFMSDVDEMRKVIKPVMALMDGRTDWLENSALIDGNGGGD